MNDESVEVTKSAFRLKTAKKDDRLIVLNDHIRCGNSLIDDPAVAGGKTTAESFLCLNEVAKPSVSSKNT